MGSRRMVCWRAYIYANNLHSLPYLTAGNSFRDWCPFVYRHSPIELHRVMKWVNRDVSVLIRSSKIDMMSVYDTILSLLPHASMRSPEFSGAISSFFGSKTNHFVHELINFARSPYNDIIAYECNVLYHVVDDLPDDAPSTSAAARAKLSMLNGVRSFLDFSLHINEDDCCGVNIDTEFENDAEVLIEDQRKPVVFELRRIYGAGERRTLATAVTQKLRRVPANVEEVNGVDAADIELEMAIHRSMLDANNQPGPFNVQRTAVGAGAAPMSSSSGIVSTPAAAAARSVDTTAAVPMQNYDDSGANGVSRMKRRRIAFHGGRPR